MIIAAQKAMSKAFKPLQDVMTFLEQKWIVIRLNHLSPTKIPNETPKPTTDKTHNKIYWYDKLLGRILIDIIIIILGAIILYLIKHYLNLPL
ncbi:MAG: hypothetical protein AABY22_31065 [Nanoarchaeota archaeon]